MERKASPAAAVLVFFTGLFLRRSCLTRRELNKQGDGEKVNIALTQLLPAKGFGIGVETEQNGLVAKRVLLLCPRALLDLLARRTNNRLDLSRIDQTSDIRIGDFGSGQTMT